MKDEAVTVGGEDERDVQGFGVVQCLLDTVPNAALVVLGLNQGNRGVRLVVKDIVGSLPLAAGDQLPPHDDTALREAHLLADLRQLVPTRPMKGGRDELGANITFRETAHIHSRDAKR